MKLGIAYYPERCNREQWEKDYQKMAAAGITTIRIAEFAWSRLEPFEGKYNWQWLDDSIELAGEFGLKVIICTPTACPPIWLVEKYPEVLPVNEKAERMVFGKRQHRCYNSQRYIEYTVKIVEAMTERYGKNPNVSAWQIDNELGGERQRCYCSICESAFQKYLEEKYTNIENLNLRWGNFFWAEEFQNFQQIRVPLEINGQLMIKHNPSLELEFWRFSSNSIVNYSNLQAGIIRKHSSSIVTTNTDTFFYGDCVNVHELFKELDIGGMDLYSSVPYEIAFYSDFTGSLKNGRFWMMEFSVASKDICEEMNKLSQNGCEFLSFFKMNPFPWGQEQGYNGLLTMTGGLTDNYHKIAAWHKENADRKQDICNLSTVGIYYSFDSSWTFSIASWDEGTDKWIYPKYLLHTIYRGLFEKSKHARFIFDSQGIEELDILIMPMHVIYERALEEALVKFVERGGKLVVTEDFFTRNQDNVYLTSIPESYPKLLGWKDDRFIPETQLEDGPVLIENAFGKGRTWVVRKTAGSSDWGEIINKVCDK